MRLEGRGTYRRGRAFLETGVGGGWRREVASAFRVADGRAAANGWWGMSDMIRASERGIGPEP
jgi:hypothetical protein